VQGLTDRFVYHPMFRSVLRHDLRVTTPEAERSLLVAAGQWYASNEDAVNAARYYVEAEDWRRVAGLVDRFARPMFESGDVKRVVDWVDQIPASADPYLLPGLDIRRAYLHTMLGESDRAAQLLHDGARKRAPGESVAINVLRASWGFIDADPDFVIRSADAALETLPAVDPDDLPNIFGMTAASDMEVMAASARARALWYLGDVGSARTELAERAKRPNIYAPWMLHTISALSVLEAWAGNLRVARIHTFRALGLARTAGLLNHPAVIDTRLAAAHVYREKGTLRGAFGLLQDAKEIVGRTRRPISQALVAVELALLHLSQGEAEEGLDVLEQYWIRGERPPPLIESWFRAAEVQLVLLLGDADRAESIVRSAGADLLGGSLAAASIQVAVARRDFDAACDRLDGWVPDPAVPRAALEHDLWSAVLDLEAGRTKAAVDMAAAVVRSAERESHVRLFLDGGRPVYRLLRALLHAGSAPYAQRLLRATMALESDAHPSLRLSKRELEVIRYLPTPLSNAEIAARLYVSLNTLKTHLRTIYRKLGVKGRRDAIKRAQQLGIA
jgi:LuxR family maltose regulon positive regulatory protein